MIMGDFNGHIGDGEDGIRGNWSQVNSNGVLLKNFIKTNELVLINADKTRTTGLYTDLEVYSQQSWIM